MCYVKEQPSPIAHRLRKHMKCMHLHNVAELDAIDAGSIEDAPLVCERLTFFGDEHFE